MSVELHLATMEDITDEILRRFPSLHLVVWVDVHEHLHLAYPRRMSVDALLDELIETRRTEEPKRRFRDVPPGE